MNDCDITCRNKCAYCSVIAGSLENLNTQWCGCSHVYLHKILNTNDMVVDVRFILLGAIIGGDDHRQG